MLKRLISGWAQRAGYTIIPNWQLSTYAATADLRRRFACFGIDLVIDVGANDGQFRDLVRERAAYTGEIISFEPIPAAAAGLATRAKSDPRWTVRQEALGAADGQGNFRIMASSQFSSLLAPRHDDVSMFAAENTVVEQIPVRVTTLATVLKGPDAKDAHRVFLKLDTQGFDLEVLKGAADVLDRVVAIQTEAAVRALYEGGAHYTEIIRFLEDKGFVMSNILPNNEGHFPLLVEFDLHFVRADLVAHLRPHG